MARGEPTWHTSSTGPDVDAELERRRGHQRPEVAGAQAVLHPQAAVLRQAAVVGGHLRRARGARRADGRGARTSAGCSTNTSVVRCSRDVLGDAVDDLAELLGRRHRGELGVGQLDADRQPAGVAAVHDGGRRGRRPAPLSSARRLLDGPLRGRQADALGPASELEVLETLEGEREVRAPLVACQGVDLVDDDRGHRAEHGPAALRRDEEVEALGRGDEEGRRAPSPWRSGPAPWCRRCAPPR